MSTYYENQNVQGYYFGTLSLDATRFLHFVGRERPGIWNSFPEVTEAFINLSQNDSIQENDLQLIERYVVLVYDKMSPLMTVNECRRELFS